MDFFETNVRIHKDVCSENPSIKTPMKFDLLTLFFANDLQIN